jgi:hypothetical protein
MARTLAGVLTAFVLSSTAAFAAPVAQATPSDDAFLAALKTLNIPTASDDAAIKIGHDVCTAVDAGKVEPAKTLRGMLSAFMNQGLTKNQAANLIWSAVGAYCPENTSLVGR